MLKIDGEIAIHLRKSKLMQEQSLEAFDDRKSLFAATIKDTGQLRCLQLGFPKRVRDLKPAAFWGGVFGKNDGDIINVSAF